VPFLLRQRSQPIEILEPEGLQQRAQRAERAPVCTIEAAIPVAPLADQAGLSEDPQVLRDRRPGHVVEV